MWKHVHIILTNVLTLYWLQFFGQLCRLASKYLAKSIFVNRLTSFYNGDIRQSGFITDAYRILSKYNLTDFLETYVTSGDFPTKCSWKLTLQTHDLKRKKQEQMDNVVNNENADYLHNVLNIETTSRLWNICKRKLAIADICRTLNRTVAMCVSRKFLSPCAKCQTLCVDIVEHLLTLWTGKSELRKQLWISLINEMGTEWFLNFIQKSAYDQCNTILGLALLNDNVDFNLFPVTRSLVQLMSWIELHNYVASEYVLHLRCTLHWHMVRMSLSS